MFSSKPLQVAVVGGGYWGPNLMRNFHALGALGAVCDRDPAALAKLKAEYPGVKTYDDFSGVLADSAISGVVIATPASTHFGLAAQAMEAGKHVFVEKPLALSSRESEEMARAADRLGRVLMVGHILEYHPVYERLVELVRQGELGEVKHIRSSRLSLGKLRREEDVLWSFAPHDVSLVLGLLGAEPTEVHAFGQAILQPTIADQVHVDLRFASGAAAHIHVSWIEPQKLHQLVVIGSRKMAIFEDSRTEGKLRLFDLGFDPVDAGWVLRRGDESIVDPPTGEPMARECRHFLDCMTMGSRPKSDGWSGVRVLRVLEAATQQMAPRMTEGARV